VFSAWLASHLSHIESLPNSHHTRDVRLVRIHRDSTFQPLCLAESIDKTEAGVQKLLGNNFIRHFQIPCSGPHSFSSSKSIGLIGIFLAVLAKERTLQARLRHLGTKIQSSLLVAGWPTICTNQNTGLFVFPQHLTQSRTHGSLAGRRPRCSHAMRQCEWHHVDSKL
jgi:hypothetical protein